MGWWRQLVSVKAQTALTLSHPGFRRKHTRTLDWGKTTTYKHKTKHDMIMEAEYIHVYTVTWSMTEQPVLFKSYRQ